MWDLATDVRVVSELAIAGLCVSLLLAVVVIVLYCGPKKGFGNPIPNIADVEMQQFQGPGALDRRNSIPLSGPHVAEIQHTVHTAKD